MVDKINIFLEPIESLIGKYRKYIWYLFIFLSFISLSLIFFSKTVKLTGEQALNFLWFLLFLPIFSKVFGLSIAQKLMPLRKEIGIFMGTLAIVHACTYLYPNPGKIFESYFWIKNGFISYTFFWLFALILTSILLITSNNWAIRKLWKNWKRLHRIVYGIIIFTVAHVVVLKFVRAFEVGPVLLLIIYFSWKTLEWKWITFYTQAEKKYKKWQKWLCVPCGYIYDPIFGDEDSGILPGTEFSDIPRTWRCPVCGVSKADFIPYIEWVIQIQTYWAKIVERTLLNPTTMELIIETEDSLESKKWQFASFIWNDNEWEFFRSYSIAKQEWKRYTFLIKLNKLGRWAQLIEKIEPNANIRIRWFFGNFTLNETSNSKVFIATGTGLAPIYNMINSLPNETKKVLYFSVATESELFYIEKLRAIPNLELHIYITRENIKWFESGRVNASEIDWDIDTEWYLCGNPKMVSETIEKLENRGFIKIYSEEFS